MTFNDPWPQDPRLDSVHDAVWELSRAGQVAAYLTCQVIRMRSFPLFWIQREWLWYQVNWLDGRQDRPQEDYGPGWLCVAESEQGRFDYDDVDGLEFDAKPVEGPHRDMLRAAAASTAAFNAACGSCSPNHTTPGRTNAPQCLHRGGCIRQPSPESTATSSAESAKAAG